MIADDSPEMRWLVRTAVGDQFGEIIEAENGRELFWWLLRADFRGVPTNTNVIVTDLCMPEYDGLSVIDAWHELVPNGRAILITAFPSDAVRRRAAELGAIMLSKPVSTATLREVISELKRRQEAGHGNHGRP